jgi:hypothetical protein
LFLFAAVPELPVVEWFLENENNFTHFIVAGRRSERALYPSKWSQVSTKLIIDYNFLA